MKKYILITIIALVTFSCETKTVEVENGGGEINDGSVCWRKIILCI